MFKCECGAPADFWITPLTTGWKSAFTVRATPNNGWGPSVSVAHEDVSEC